MTPRRQPVQPNTWSTVDADGILRESPHQRAEAVHESPIDVVGENDEIGTLYLDELDQQLDGVAVECDARRVPRVDEEKCLDLRVLKRLEVCLGELVSIFPLRPYGYDVQTVVLEMRDLENRA